MKLAILSFGFTGSTLPLVHSLLNLNQTVDYYFCTFFNKKKDTYEAFEIDSIPIIPMLKQVNVRRCKGTDGFFMKDNFRLYKAIHVGAGERRNVALRLPLYVISRIIVYIYAWIIKLRKYDAVYIIGQEQLSGWYHETLKNSFHGFHEVVIDHADADSDSALQPTVNMLARMNVPLIFYSNYSKEVFLRCYPSYKNAFVFPFGLFETYRYWGNNVIVNELNDVKDYVLMYGYIVPYKGLDFLYQAIIENSQMNTLNYRIVVAGNGKDKTLDLMKKDKRFLVINRWISNDELVELIRKAKIVVCPYKSASQSGIPQTVFLFGKPIIATNVGAFNDIIQSGVNGFLVKYSQTEMLFNTIEKLMSDTELYESVQHNIQKWELLDNEYNWNKIAVDYIEWIHSYFCKSSKKCL